VPFPIGEGIVATEKIIVFFFATQQTYAAHLSPYQLHLKQNASTSEYRGGTGGSGGHTSSRQGLTENRRAVGAGRFLS
jgi:hypothetical protein